MKVVAIAGSLRARSSNLALLRAAAKVKPAAMELVFYDGLGRLPHFNPELDGEGDAPPPEVAALRTLLGGADGLLISCPEYAHGVPGSLKNALDWLVSFPELPGKPVVLLNASAAGGQWAQAALVEILRTMSLDVLDGASRLQPFVEKKLVHEDDACAATLEALRESLAALASAIAGR